MSLQFGLSRFVHAFPRFGEPPPASPVRQAHASTVRHVFELIWSEAFVECSAGETGCRVDVRLGGLQHAIDVPWALVEVDQGLVLVRAIYRAGLPSALQRAVADISLTL